MLVISDNYFFQCSNLKVCCKIGILGLDKKSDNSTSLHNKYPKLSEMKSQTFLSNNIDLIRNIRLGLLFHILKNRAKRLKNDLDNSDEILFC